jgi:hypothetical protein
MKTNEQSTTRSHPSTGQYALVRGPVCWHLTLAGRQASFKHELGALYVAYLLLHPSREPLHAVALALKAREASIHPAAPDELNQQERMGLPEAGAARELWRRQVELERVIADRHQIEPVKAEALRELEEVSNLMRSNHWLSCHGAGRCVRAVSAAIKRFHAHLVEAVDAEGRPAPVLQGFARHLYHHMLVPSGRGYRGEGRWLAMVPGGCFTYYAPSGVVWSAECAARNSECGMGSLEPEAQPSKVRVLHPLVPRPAALGFLSRFLCTGVALAVLVTGCVGPRPLRGGKAATSRNQAGHIQQTLAQGENASQPTKQDQETVKVRTYTLPAGSQMEASAVAPSQTAFPPSASPKPSTHNTQPSTTNILSAPRPVVEREETRARTELGAAQKDTARDLAAKLSSLKGIVWVGVGMFIFGLASLVYPPLKVIVASVTTSAALMLGGVALMVLPTMVVGNELLILAVVALVVGAWFLAHRHGQLSGVVAASTASSTANSAPATAAPSTGAATPATGTALRESPMANGK